MKGFKITAQRRLSQGIVVLMAFWLLSTHTLMAVPFHLPGGGLNRLYNDDPDEFAAPAVAIKGPCGHAYPGYLMIFEPIGLRVDTAAVVFDRTQLVPLPTEAVVPAATLPPVDVAPLNQPASIFETASGNGDGTLSTLKTHDAITWSASSSPETEEPVTPLIPAEAVPSLPLPIIPSQVNKPSAAPATVQPLTLPAQLLYFFQQPLQTNNSKSSIVMPFEVPVQGQGTTTPPPSPSKATFISD